jgi:succinyl-diaminopimelate desuccinylase
MNEAAQTEFLAALVRTPSDNPPGDCAAHAAVAARLLEGLGFTVERHPVPDAAVRAAGMISATNLVVRHQFGPASGRRGPVIALNAHGDVVPPGEGWTHDPYGAAIAGGWMYGRGVAVSKSDIATYAFALQALIESGAPLRGVVELHITYDEEAGGMIGPAWLLEQGISRPDLALCAGFSYQIVTAHNGCLHLEVEVAGRSAHAAKPETGHDALEAATSIMTALYAYRRGLTARVSALPGIGSPQLTIGLIKGGINTNVVPDHVVFRLDRRLIPEERIDDVLAEMEREIGAAARGFPHCRVTIRPILRAAPLQRQEGAAPLIAALARHAGAVFGVRVPEAAVPLYTDARHYAEAGIPVALYGAGPRTLEEANAHRADERLRLDDLHKATDVVARALADMLA